MSQFVKPFAKLRTAALCPDTSRGVLTGQANARFAPALSPARSCLCRAWSNPYARYKMLPAAYACACLAPIRNTLENIRLRKITYPSKKNIPCNCNKLRPFVFAARGAYPDALGNTRRTTCAVLPTVAHGAGPFLSSTKRAIRIGKIILPHSYKSENAKKVLVPPSIPTAF